MWNNEKLIISKRWIDKIQKNNFYKKNFVQKFIVIWTEVFHYSLENTFSQLFKEIAADLVTVEHFNLDLLSQQHRSVLEMSL